MNCCVRKVKGVAGAYEILKFMLEEELFSTFVLNIAEFQFFIIT